MFRGYPSSLFWGIVGTVEPREGSGATESRAGRRLERDGRERTFDGAFPRFTSERWRQSDYEWCQKETKRTGYIERHTERERKITFRARRTSKVFFLCNAYFYLMRM